MVTAANNEAISLDSKALEIDNKIKEKERTLNSKGDEIAENSFVASQKSQALKGKIDEHNAEISALRSQLGTHDRAKNKTSKISQYLVISVLVLLTIFLWLFYTSALHSALIRDIDSEQAAQYELATYDEVKSIQNTTSIINLNAISDAWTRNGFFGVLLIMVAFSVPLSAGLLIYTFRRQKTKKMITIIGTIIFDMILAYHLVHTIYLAKHKTTPGYEEEWQPYFALFDIQFLLILSISSVAYIMWGTHLDYILAAHDQDAPILHDIAKKKEEIITINDDILEIEKQLEKRHVEINLEKKSYQVK